MRWAVAVVVLVVPAVRGYGQELPRAAMQYGAFGFPDLSGGRLITVPDLPRAAMPHTALCGDGRRVAVRFERRQPEREGLDGRRWPGNFDGLAGDVFRLTQGKVEDGSCFLASDALLSGATLLRAERPGGASECGGDVRERLGAARGRRVVNCWLIARLPANRRVVLAEFVRQDMDALASVAVIDRDRTIFADYPAVFRGEGADLWRVDDGGVLTADEFEVVFVLQRGGVYTLGIDWLGAEGRSLSLFVSNGGDRFTKVIADYWYRAPL